MSLSQSKQFDHTSAEAVCFGPSCMRPDRFQSILAWFHASFSTPASRPICMTLIISTNQSAHWMNYSEDWWGTPFPETTHYLQVCHFKLQVVPCKPVLNHVQLHFLLLLSNLTVTFTQYLIACGKYNQLHALFCSDMKHRLSNEERHFQLVSALCANSCPFCQLHL